MVKRTKKKKGDAYDVMSEINSILKGFAPKQARKSKRPVKNKSYNVMNEINSILANYNPLSAPVKQQKKWKNMPSKKKNMFSKFLPDIDNDGVPDLFDCQPLNPKMDMAKLYHVTSKKNVPKLQKEGIKYQKKATFSGPFGQDLRDKGTIYAFKEKNDARRWASKTEWENKKPTSVITFDEPDENDRTKRDLNPEMQMLGKGSAVKIKGSIHTTKIEKVEDYDDNMRKEMMDNIKEERKEMEGKEMTIEIESKEDVEEQEDAELEEQEEEQEQEDEQDETETEEEKEE